MEREERQVTEGGQPKEKECQREREREREREKMRRKEKRGFEENCLRIIL